MRIWRLKDTRMKMNYPVIVLAIFCSAILSTTFSATAQQPVIKSKHDAWQIQCEGAKNKTVNAADLVKELEANQTAEKKKDAEPAKAIPDEQCGMVQTVKSKDRPNIGLSVIIFRNKKKDKTEGTLLRVLAPSGVFLPNGLAMEIDGTAQGRIGFLRCLPNGCIAQAEVQDKLLKALKSGSAVNFIIYEAPGRGLALSVSLKGFTAAYKALKT